MAKAMNINVNTEAKPIENEPTYMDALKQLAVINDRQEKYSISLSKYIKLEDYIKTKRDVTNYDVIEKQNEKFEVVLYNHNRVVERMKGVICNGASFQIPRSSVAKRGCYLYNIYVKFRLFA